MSDQCIVPGCEIIPEPRAREIWEEARRRGYPDEVFYGKCLAHIRDKVARGRIKVIEEQKQEAKEVAMKATMRNGQEYQEGEVTSKKTAMLLMTSVAIVNNLVEFGFLRARGLRGGHKAIEFESIREFVALIECGDFSAVQFRSLPDNVLDQLYEDCPDIAQNLRLHEEKSQDGAPD